MGPVGAGGAEPGGSLRFDLQHNNHRLRTLVVHLLGTHGPYLVLERVQELPLASGECEVQGALGLEAGCCRLCLNLQHSDV